MDSAATPLGRLADHPLLTLGQEVALMRRIEAGDLRARDELVRCNMRLVLQAAWAHSRANGVDVEELVQAGSLGLLRAIAKYEWRRGHKFSTYATWWVNHAITRSLTTLRPGMRIAPDVRSQMRTLVRAEDRLMAAALGGPAAADDVQRLTGMDAAEIARVQEWRARTFTSLDRPLREDSDATLRDTIPDPATSAIDDIAARDAERASIESLMHLLAPRERTLLTMRFGLGGGRCYNLAEVGRELDMAPIAVRRLERMILRRLQAHMEEDACRAVP